jgi:hypothetical protein
LEKPATPRIFPPLSGSTSFERFAADPISETIGAAGHRKTEDISMIRDRKMCKVIGSCLIATSMTTWLASQTSASETASATIAETPLGGGVFQYNLALTNTSTDSSKLGTFWFSWIPGQDYMQVKPTSVVDPAGWTFTITGSNNASDGNAIEWVDGGTLVAPGATLSGFQFDSTETLNQILGPTPFDGGTALETTSFVYQGAPFSDSGFKFNVTAVPEPASLSAMLLSGVLLLGRKRHRAMPARATR